jgi:hypothetical protein
MTYYELAVFTFLAILSVVLMWKFAEANREDEVEFDEIRLGGPFLEINRKKQVVDLNARSEQLNQENKSLKAEIVSLIDGSKTLNAEIDKLRTESNFLRLETLKRDFMSYVDFEKHVKNPEMAEASRRVELAIDIVKKLRQMGDDGWLKSLLNEVRSGKVRDELWPPWVDPEKRREKLLSGILTLLM